MSLKDLHEAMGKWLIAAQFPGTDCFIVGITPQSIIV